MFWKAKGTTSADFPMQFYFSSLTKHISRPLVRITDDEVSKGFNRMKLRTGTVKDPLLEAVYGCAARAWCNRDRGPSPTSVETQDILIAKRTKGAAWNLLEGKFMEQLKRLNKVLIAVTYTFFYSYSASIWSVCNLHLLTTDILSLITFITVILESLGPFACMLYLT